MNRVLNTVVSNMEAEAEFNDPTEKYVKTCDDKIINHIKMMRAGNVIKPEPAVGTVMTVTTDTQYSTHTQPPTSDQPTATSRELSPVVAQLREYVEVQSTNMEKLTENSKKQSKSRG